MSSIMRTNMVYCPQYENVDGEVQYGPLLWTIISLLLDQSEPVGCICPWLPKYSGTIHPQEWLKQVLIFCYFNQIKDDKEVLNICKTMINSTIIIPNVNEIKSFEELIEALKLHSTFNI
ncbi:hypothetical protein RhiirC2_852499 [Rhizophagus irregularis]|uniref:Uncharacterized protein n=1 Tax=Rhizophagus irregularis TaxID=588596 RepID=A0A2N1MZH9_9GLOM|nr:hypothetical protein RhiirC2_852499 [Rhizophagus irregularis]